MSNEFNDLYGFDEYVLNAKERNLWRKNELIPLSTKVFDTLFMLVERHGEVLEKEEMLATIWNDTFVEENNLSQKISILRKTFGKDKNFIETVPRKGFRFVEEVKVLSDADFEKLYKNPQVSEKNQNSPKIKNTNNNLPPENAYFFQRRPLLLTLGVIIFISLSFAVYSYYNTLKITSNESTIPEIKALTDTGNIRFPTISPDGNSLAYVENDSPNLFIKDLLTGNKTEVRIDEELVPGFTQFSPDGIYIYFRTRKRKTELADVYRVPTYGGSAELIIKDAWGLFEVSPDGKEIVYIKQNQEQKRYDLIIKNIYSKTENILISKNYPKTFFLDDSPSWSSDGRRILLIQLYTPKGSGKLLVIDVETKKEQILEFEAIKAIRQSHWLPSSNELLLIATTQKATEQIFRVDFPSGNISKITNDLKKYRELSVSKDGKKVVARSHNIYANIWYLPEGDIKHKKQITEGTQGLAGLFGISWTPSNKIVHYQFGGNESQIRIVDPTDKSGRILAQNPKGISQYPKVTPDGKNVFFQSTEKGKVKIKSVNIENEKAEILYSQKDQIELYPVISPDGEWVYYIEQNKNISAISRRSLTENKKETIFKQADFSPSSFLAISPNGKYLAFNYKKSEKKQESKTQNVGIKVGFIDLENNFKLKTLEVPASRPYIQFTNGGKTFDYIGFNSKNSSKIFRRDFAEDSEPKIIAEIEKEKFYYFSWSKDEKDLAVSIGNNPTDAILFELK